MLRIFLILSTVLFSILPGMGQRSSSENLVVIVLDGMRWQEVFAGADSALINNPSFTRNKNRVLSRFWDADPQIRRKKLFPFFWRTIATSGQLYGNRWQQSYVNVRNPYQLTYPGFSEMLTGHVNHEISSNRLVTNKSTNVLETINAQKGFEYKVALFATSDLFPFLMDRKNSKVYVNADSDSLAFAAPEFMLLNEMQHLTAKPTTERPDLLTYFAAKEYVKKYKPRVLYLAMGETDAFAHEGNYDQYLETALAQDKMIERFWTMIQSMPQYKNKTTLLITCDHGRGDAAKQQWTSHGPNIPDSGEIWIAAMGPSTKAYGEMKGHPAIYQEQLAATMAAVLGLPYKPATHIAAPPVESIFSFK
ncbi:hypothetical protein DYBT9275_04654 [Dyadobacter sp. CECT 9275]|uniref:Phosphoglyceromutase n=1 Tax=Dyadobacter helix TaxID=2822344 RepID=A0A916JJC3_9BACT|nr:alkaline phosphatase family protein [Dyadobacter sp. CECT 9275]CAG5010149.1 hypothetical protein DYBT9275_04654 [Dyadobacter sp. CECT 9275]